MRHEIAAPWDRGPLRDHRDNMDNRTLVDGARLLAALDQAVQTLGRPRELEDTLNRIVHAAVDTVPGAEHAGIGQLGPDGRIESRARTSDTVAQLKRWQSEFGEGPYVNALWHERTMVVADLAAETSRWPNFAPYARSVGVASILCFRLTLEDQPLGALTLYATRPGAFDAEARTIGGLFASQAALALGTAEQAHLLSEAVTSRDLVGQATGILMERFRISDDKASHLLLETSHDTQVPLIKVARWLISECGPSRRTK